MCDVATAPRFDNTSQSGALSEYPYGINEDLLQDAPPTPCRALPGEQDDAVEAVVQEATAHTAAPTCVDVRLPATSLYRGARCRLGSECVEEGDEAEHSSA